MSPRVARVLVDSPLPQLDRLFDYAIPERLADDVVPGVRVTVPLRSAGRTSNGLVVELADGADFEGSLSELDQVVSPARVLAPEVWALARRVADRQAGSANDVLRLAIPSRAVRVEKQWLAGAGGAPEPPRAAHPVTGYEPGLIEAALDRGGRLALRAIPQLVALPRPASAPHVELAHAGRSSASGDEAEAAVWVGHWALTLAQAAVRVLVSGASAILAVPDYRDQEQLVAALDALGASGSVAALDARQSKPQRYAAFLSCLGEEPRIIVGNRSAVYAPAARLGLIALYDDGDPLFAEPLAPYAHARDVALIRQDQQGCALVLAGHTRSVEAQRLVELRFLEDVAPNPAVTPHVVATALQAARGPAADGSRIPSSAWTAAREALAKGPVLVQVASPGYAKVLACGRCREAARCTVCRGPLGLASGRSAPACGWCGAVARDWHCSNCNATTLRMVTRGSGRTAEELGRAFPGVRVVVSDGERPLTRVAATPALVVATRGAEPIAAGGYAAVLLLDGERMLARESLHVGDDCLRWWSDAAVLAAPRAPVVLVGVDGPLAQTLTLWQQHAYAAAQLVDRKTLAFPPAVRVASVTGRPAAVAAALAALEPGRLRDVLGPAPVPAARTGEEDAVRAIVRFDYADGQAVATALRGAVVRGATGTRRPPVGERRTRPAPTLRVKLDDPEIL